MIGLDYTHYSAISSIENNWGIPVGSLGTGDNSSTMASESPSLSQLSKCTRELKACVSPRIKLFSDVFSWVANITGHKNNGLSSLTTIPVANVIIPASAEGEFEIQEIRFHSRERRIVE